MNKDEMNMAQMILGTQMYFIDVSSSRHVQDLFKKIHELYLV